MAWLLCGVLTAVAAGCGSAPPGEAADETEPPVRSGATGSRSTAAIDVCSLVSREEVEAATGEAIVQVEASGGACSYQTADAMASSVRIELGRVDARDEMRAARDASGILGRVGGEMRGRAGAEGDVGELLRDADSVPGLGEDAFFDGNQQLHVLKNDVYFTVSPPMMRPRTGSGSPILTAEEKRGMALAIAERVAARL